ncbi:hypothetical protein [Krasilnikovia sp. M28-CT-15]|uniref:hypothetical protein n=1 Tax=Krasilnikovia sp. M28-CT-15 TaxID=3373540 RepID=UPI00399D215D
MLVLASNYVLLWFTSTALVWAVVEVMLVALAGFAAAKDLSVVHQRHPLRRIERIALISAAVLVLLWLVVLVLLNWAAPEGGADVFHLLTGLIVAIPVLPLAALALPGTMAFRHARKPERSALKISSASGQG